MPLMGQLVIGRKKQPTYGLKYLTHIQLKLGQLLYHVDLCCTVHEHMYGVSEALLS